MQVVGVVLAGLKSSRLDREVGERRFTHRRLTVLYLTFEISIFNYKQQDIDDTEELDAEVIDYNRRGD
jgi:hypothetical protein